MNSRHVVGLMLVGAAAISAEAAEVVGSHQRFRAGDIFRVSGLAVPPNPHEQGAGDVFEEMGLVLQASSTSTSIAIAKALHPLNSLAEELEKGGR